MFLISLSFHFPGCPDPGTCGFTPIPCSGCIANASTTSCPDPSLCYQGLSTPPCMNCMTGMAMPYCPDPNVCVVEPEPTPEVVHCTGCIDSTWTESQYTQNTSARSMFACVSVCIARHSDSDGSVRVCVLSSLSSPQVAPSLSFAAISQFSVSTVWMAWRCHSVSTRVGARE